MLLVEQTKSHGHALKSILSLVYSDSEELLLLLFFAMVFLALYVF